MSFLLRITTDSAAFHDEATGDPRPGPETARILLSVAALVSLLDGDDRAGSMVRDVNGNTCGRWSFTQQPGPLAELPALTWSELDHLGHLLDNSIEAIEAAQHAVIVGRGQSVAEKDALAAEWSQANALRTAVREAQYSIPEEHR